MWKTCPGSGEDVSGPLWLLISGPKFGRDLQEFVGPLLIVKEGHRPTLGDGDVKETEAMSRIVPGSWVQMCAMGHSMYVMEVPAGGHQGRSPLQLLGELEDLRLGVICYYRCCR